MTSTRNRWRKSTWFLAAVVFAGTYTFVLVACVAAPTWITTVAGVRPSAAHSLVDRMTGWDGKCYLQIATNGYSLSRRQQSNIVFFPAYPLTARFFQVVTGMSISVSLLVVSACFLFASVFTLDRYIVETRSTNAVRTRLLPLLSLALFPTSFFHRMAYTESMFLFLVLLSMYGMQRHWPAAVLAVIIGIATATRSVGLALLFPFALHLWRNFANRADNGNGADGWLVRYGAASMKALLLLLVASWGLFVFAGYQTYRFGDPLAFVRSQGAWREREAPKSWVVAAFDLGTLEPIRSTYDSASPCYWARHPPTDPLFSLPFANPIIFLGCVALIIVGYARQWLTTPEFLLSIVLLLVPYMLQGPRMCMTSQARFCSVVFPVYIVCGVLLSRLPWMVCTLVLGWSAVLLAGYTLLFCNAYYLV